LTPHNRKEQQNMNVYKVTYILDGEEHYDHIVERTEKAAQKRLRGIHKAAEIIDTELTSTDAPATKEQEREALETIRALLADLGPQSYLRTAFEGCLEDAEQNIEDDAAYSMKARFELEAQRAIDRGHEIDQLKAEIKRLNSGIEELIQKDDERKAALERLAEKQLSEQFRQDLMEMTTAEAQASRARMAKAADMMALCADNPACVGFKEAVDEYRKEKERAVVMEQRTAVLDAMGPEKD